MSKSPFHLAFIGECMVELKEVRPQCARQAFAGDTLNSAIYTRRVLPASIAKVSFISGIGDDNMSGAMKAMWQAEGIATEHMCEQANKAPGLYYIHVDAEGERSFSYWRSDSAAKTMFAGAQGDALLHRLSEFDCLYLSGITLAILPECDLHKLFAALDHYSGKVFFDNNYRPRLWDTTERAQAAYRQMLTHCHTALLTWDDEQALFGFDKIEETRAQCEHAGVTEIVIKRGSEPCLIYNGGTEVAVAAQQVEHVVDTTAAGDSFSAAYISARLQKKSPDIAARWGHTLAASVIQHDGGIIPQTAMPELI